MAFGPTYNRGNAQVWIEWRRSANQLRSSRSLEGKVLTLDGNYSEVESRCTERSDNYIRGESYAKPCRPKTALHGLPYTGKETAIQKPVVVDMIWRVSFNSHRKKVGRRTAFAVEGAKGRIYGANVSVSCTRRSQLLWLTSAFIPNTQLILLIYHEPFLCLTSCKTIVIRYHT